MNNLQLRMNLLLLTLFGLLFLAVTAIGEMMGLHDIYFYLGVSVFMMFLQYSIGPNIVEWTMRVRYVTPQEHADLHLMVEDLAHRAGIPKPRIGIAQISVPNAFAFGRGVNDGRICVTQGIMNLLSKEELRAVLGHEMSHLKNRDVMTITILSVIPMVFYSIFRAMMWGSFTRGRREERGGGMLIGLAALILYFVTNLLVLYGSRIREYFADKGSIDLGNRPHALASALYKLVYGSARVSREDMAQVEGMKAFFANDPSQAKREFTELKSLDLDRSGTIDEHEMNILRTQDISVGIDQKMMELFSTHPNMLKRIKELSRYN
jgi:heat shock protein HtpX